VSGCPRCTSVHFSCPTYNARSAPYACNTASQLQTLQAADILKIVMGSHVGACILLTLSLALLLAAQHPCCCCCCCCCCWASRVPCSASAQLSSAQPEGLLCLIDNTNSCLQDFLSNLSDLCIVPAFELTLLQDGRWGCCLPAAAAAEPLPVSSAAVLC
jgi:hypothetical protein